MTTYTRGQSKEVNVVNTICRQKELQTQFAVTKLLGGCPGSLCGNRERWPVWVLIREFRDSLIGGQLSWPLGQEAVRQGRQGVKAHVWSKRVLREHDAENQRV